MKEGVDGECQKIVRAQNSRKTQKESKSTDSVEQAMDIVKNVELAVKSTIKTLEDASVSEQIGTKNVKQTKTNTNKLKATKLWQPARVRGTIYRNKISKQKIVGLQRTQRAQDWAQRNVDNFFQTGEAICRFCFQLASDADTEVFVVSFFNFNFKIRIRLNLSFCRSLTIEFEKCMLN